MKIKYKIVKVPMPHCGDCGQELAGNGSIMAPYNCICGFWDIDWDKNNLTYTLKAKNEN